MSRTSSHAQPLVYPSSFNTPNVAAVVPIETLNSAKSNAFPYGPRALNVQQVKKLMMRSHLPRLTFLLPLQLRLTLKSAKLLILMTRRRKRKVKRNQSTSQRLVNSDRKRFELCQPLFQSRLKKFLARISRIKLKGLRFLSFFDKR